MKSTNLYTSVACNCTPECADWGQRGLLFGARNAIGLFETQYNHSSAKIRHTYVQHTNRVNIVRWLRSNTSSENETHFLSGADDGLAILWQIEQTETPKWYPLKGHTKGVNAVDGLQRANGELCLATAAADSTVKLWKFDGSECTSTQTIDLKGGFCFSLRLTLFPKSESIILALSADNDSVPLWCERHTTSKSEDSIFHIIHELKGHEDWVRGLDFVLDGDDLLLATSSQDNFIRIWRLSRHTKNEPQNVVDISNLWNGATGEIRLEDTKLQLDTGLWMSVSLESVLYGHENWVYSVHWNKSIDCGLRLLSASFDKTLIIWSTSEDGIWLDQVRVGEVGGNSLGFFGGKFSNDGKSIFGHSYQGGFHIWSQSAENTTNWTPSVIVGGHFGEVRDLAWEPDGQYLMSVSADQTTRIHAPWKRDMLEETWHEIARPQVHGYDMQALALLSRYKFASGAEEKIVRTFQASANFIENFRRITHITQDPSGDVLLESLPKGASVPSLGLSNKAVFDVEQPDNEKKHVKDEYPENYFVPITLETPPQEETLMQNTLWPEVQKLYGHGFEIYALTASLDGQILASACRATSAEHAQIILWNTSTWKQIQKLPGHQLTVTQMRFSPDGRYLLSVSRDRRWSLFENQQTVSTEDLPNYVLRATTDKKNSVHTRIIWACDWSHDGVHFVTSSREGKVVIWSKSEQSPNASDCLNGWQALSVLELKNESITAVAFARNALKSGVYLVATGSETGDIRLYQFDGNWLELLHLNHSQAHHLAVRRLQFRPLSNMEPNEFHLASCGEDHFVRVYKLNL